jgi:hypothetical protein
VALHDIVHFLSAFNNFNDLILLVHDGRGDDRAEPRPALAALAACRTQVSVFVRADNSNTRGDDRRIRDDCP